MIISFPKSIRILTATLPRPTTTEPTFSQVCLAEGTYLARALCAGEGKRKGDMSRKKLRVGIVGVGNCASSFVQGLTHYADAATDAPPPGLMNVELGGYHVGDIELAAAFDIHAGKV